MADQQEGKLPSITHPIPLPGTDNGIPGQAAAFVKPSNWALLTPERRRNLRLDFWASGKGIKFTCKDAESRYKERAALLRDAFDLNKKPSRVPVHTYPGFYPQFRAGLTPKSLFYDQHAKAAQAYIQYYLDLQPDFSHFKYMFSGPALELLDYQVLEWPGGQLPAERPYQFKEQEFLKGDEYDRFLSDPSDFMLRTVFPRMFKSLSGLAKLPQFASDTFGYSGVYLPFAFSEVKEAIEILEKAGQLVMETLPYTTAMLDRPIEEGFPAFYGSLAAAPFDALGNVLRGTRGMMMDLYRRPDDVVAACNRYVDIMLNNPFEFSNGSPFVFIPLHKGSDQFMSEEHFKKFYWPSLKQFMLELVEDGLIPAPFAEGSYNSRLEIIADFPEGTCLWAFDQTDMPRAAEVLDGICAIMGNVPGSLTATGTPDEMDAYCRNLVKTCGTTGNFILANGCEINEAKEENLAAMIASVQTRA